MLIEHFVQDEKASFSRVGRVYPGDYNVSFAEGQKLQKIRRTLFRTSDVLTGTLQTVGRFRKHCRELSRLKGLQDVATLLRELEDIAATVTYHKHMTTSLINYSTGTAALVSALL